MLKCGVSFQIVEPEMPVIKETIGMRFQKVRKKANMTQTEFCNVLGISRSSYSNYGNDKRDIPSSIISILSKKFDVDPLWLVDGDYSKKSMDIKLNELEEIRKIETSIIRRAEDLKIPLNAKERWRLVSLVHSMMARNDKTTIEASDRVIDAALKYGGVLDANDESAP